MQKNEVSFYSHVLGRNLQVKVYGHWGFPVLLFPTSMGNINQLEYQGFIDSVSDKISHGLTKLFVVESIDFDSFYSDHLSSKIKISNYQLYTKFLKEELIPMIQRESNVHRIGIGGCSFGGYHAANFAFKYPDLIQFLISLSGTFSIKNFLHGYYDENVYFNSPFDYLPDAESWTFNHLKIALGTSDWDICRQDNLALSRLLGQKQIDHWYDEKKWITHDWPLWKMQFPEYLDAFL